MPTSVTRAWGLAAALLVTLLITGAPALAAAPDPVAACDGTAWTATAVAGRDAVSCDDGRVRDWQRLRIEDARVARGSSGGATLVFVVTRPEAGNPVAVDYATADGTAVAGADYTAVSGQLVLEADETSATIAVPVTSLARAGDDRRLSLTLADPSGVVVLDRGHAVGWILNRFFRPEFQPDAEYMCDGGFFSLGSRPEGGKAVICLGKFVAPIVSAPVVDRRAGAATFTITRPPEADGDNPDGGYGSYFIAYSTVDGTATAGVDYTAVSGRAILSTYQRTTTVSVPVDPARARDGRTFSLQLTTDAPGTPIGVAADGRGTLVPVTATATIRRLGGPIALPESGVARVGSALTAAPGADGYAWSRCDAAGACEPIAGATARSYTPTAADAGRSLRVRATAPDPQGGTQVDDADPVGPVRPLPARPSVDGGPAEGAATAATFALAGKEDDASWECALDDGPFAACDEDGDGAVALDGLAPGAHTFAVRQRTVDGVASDPATRAWTVVAARAPDPDPGTPDPGARTPTPEPGARTPTPEPQPGAPSPEPDPRAPAPRAPAAGAATTPRVAGVREQNRSVTRAVAGATNVVLHCSRRCSLRAALTIPARDARRLGLRSTTIGSARGSTRDRGLVRLRVRLDARAAPRLLRIARPLRVVAVVPNPAGEPVRVSFRLKPAGRAAR